MSFPLRAHFSCCQLCFLTLSFLHLLSFFLSFILFLCVCIYVYMFLSIYVVKDERYKAITDGKGHGVEPFEENQRPTRVQSSVFVWIFDPILSFFFSLLSSVFLCFALLACLHLLFLLRYIDLKRWRVYSKRKEKVRLLRWCTVGNCAVLTEITV